MGDKLREILRSFGIDDDGEYYINSDGEVKKRGVITDDDTGIYQDENGHFKKKGLFFDEDTGLRQDKEGHFRKIGVFFDEKTGVYQDKDGNYLKEGIFFDEKTGYFRDKDGNIKEEGLFVDNSRISTKSQNYSGQYDSHDGSQDSEAESFIKLSFYLMVGAIIIVLAIIALTIAALLSPLILFVIYLVRKRENLWLALASIAASIYLIYDFNNSGILVSNLFDSYVPSDIKTYFSVFYIIALIAALGFAFDKFSLKNIPVSPEGNFFKKKNTKTRRFYISGLGGILIVMLSTIQYFGLLEFNGNITPTSGNNNHISKNEEIVKNSKPASNKTETNTRNFVSNAIINGTDVIIRENPTTQSKILSSFKESGEKVKIIEDYSPLNKSEYILTNNLNLNINGKTIYLKKGKAVQLLNKTGNKATVTFKDKELNTHNAVVEYSNLKDIDNKKWYKVQRQNNEIGWVFGKFVKDQREDINLGKTAIINDPDGYTNVRKGKGTNHAIITKIYNNEKFTVIPSDENWWQVRTKDGKSGYMYYDRVKLID